MALFSFALVLIPGVVLRFVFPCLPLSCLVFWLSCLVLSYLVVVFWLSLSCGCLLVVFVLGLSCLVLWLSCLVVVLSYIDLCCLVLSYTLPLTQAAPTGASDGSGKVLTGLTLALTLNPNPNPDPNLTLILNPTPTLLTP